MVVYLSNENSKLKREKVALELQLDGTKQTTIDNQTVIKEMRAEVDKILKHSECNFALLRALYQGSEVTVEQEAQCLIGTRLQNTEQPTSPANGTQPTQTSQSSQPNAPTQPNNPNPPNPPGPPDNDGIVVPLPDVVPFLPNEIHIPSPL